jgi:hypothetical protein
MTDSATTPAKYIVRYLDGPLVGQIDQRLLIDGKYENSFSVIALVEGMESYFKYKAVDTRQLNGELHVRYSFDAEDSDPVQGDDDLGNGL